MAYLAYYIDHYSPMTVIQGLYAPDSMPVNKNTLENIRESSQFASDLTSTSASQLKIDLLEKGPILTTLRLPTRHLLCFRTSYHYHIYFIVLVNPHREDKAHRNLLARKHVF